MKSSIDKIQFLIIENHNFIDYPFGGTLSFTKNILKTFENKVGLVGITTEKTEPVGKWFIKKLNNINYHYFNIGYYKKHGKHPLIPMRLSSLFQLIKYQKKIKSIGIERVFTQSPQFILGLNTKHFTNICFCFAGTTNSIAISRYKYLRGLACIYENFLFKNLNQKQYTIVAAANKKEILDTIKRSNGVLNINSIVQFPTRFDPLIFFPYSQRKARLNLNLSEEYAIFAVVGRIAEVKGWKLIIDSYREYIRITDPKKQSVLIIIGDGEDKEKLKQYANDLILQKKMILTGRVSPEKINDYLNASDLYIMGSFFEGWPTSIVEALATGKVIITTAVSGASEMIENGSNGYIVETRDFKLFADKMKKALILNNPNQKSINIAKKYSIDTLNSDFKKVWLDKCL